MYFPERWQRTFYYYGRNLSGGVDSYARCPWVTAEKSGNDLVLTVADNADGMERTTTISVTAGQAEQTITVIQLSDDDLPMRFRKLADLHSSVISPNGKWVGGYYSVGDESAGALFYIVFINLETDERIELGSLSRITRIRLRSFA